MHSVFSKESHYFKDFDNSTRLPCNLGGLAERKPQKVDSFGMTQGSSRKVSEHLGETVIYSMIQSPEECSNSKMFGNKSNDTCPKQTTNYSFLSFLVECFPKKTNITNVWVCVCVFFHKGGWHVGLVCESTLLGFHPGEVASTEGFCGRRPLVLRADAGRGEHPSRRPWRAPWLGWNIRDFTANRDVKISNRPIINFS